MTCTDLTLESAMFLDHGAAYHLTLHPLSIPSTMLHAFALVNTSEKLFLSQEFFHSKADVGFFNSEGLKALPHFSH